LTDDIIDWPLPNKIRGCATARSTVSFNPQPIQYNAE